MFCTKCGNQIPDGTAFCPACGVKISAQQPNLNNAQPTYVAPPQPAAPQNPYQQQPYQQQPYQQPYQQQINYNQTAEPASGLANLSLVMGIISFFILPVITGLVAIITGAVAKSKGNTSGKSTAGIVCGVIGVVSYVIMMIFLQSLMAELG